MSIPRMLCVVGLAILFGCGDGPAPRECSLAFTAIDTDALSGISAARLIVVKDAPGWTELWAEHKRNSSPQPSLPAVDFSQEMVVGLFLGVRPAGTCYAAEVRETYRQGGTIYVVYSETVASDAATCEAHNPSQIVILPKSDEPVEFVRAEADPLSPGAPRLANLQLLSGSTLISATRFVVIKDEPVWLATWAKLTKDQLPPPQVDFSQTMVIAMYFGNPAQCYSAQAMEPYFQDNRIIVAYYRYTFIPFVPCTSPPPGWEFAINSLQKSDAPVEFVRVVR